MTDFKPGRLGRPQETRQTDPVRAVEAVAEQAKERFESLMRQAREATEEVRGGDENSKKPEAQKDDTDTPKSEASHGSALSNKIGATAAARLVRTAEQPVTQAGPDAKSNGMVAVERSHSDGTRFARPDPNEAPMQERHVQMSRTAVHRAVTSQMDDRAAIDGPSRMLKAVADRYAGDPPQGGASTTPAERAMPETFLDSWAQKHQAAVEQVITSHLPFDTPGQVPSPEKLLADLAKVREAAQAEAAAAQTDAKDESDAALANEFINEVGKVSDEMLSQIAEAQTAMPEAAAAGTLETFMAEMAHQQAQTLSEAFAQIRNVAQETKNKPGLSDNEDDDGFEVSEVSGRGAGMVTAPATGGAEPVAQTDAPSPPPKTELPPEVMKFIESISVVQRGQLDSLQPKAMAVRLDPNVLGGPTVTFDPSGPDGADIRLDMLDSDTAAFVMEHMDGVLAQLSEALGVSVNVSVTHPETRDRPEMFTRGVTETGTRTGPLGSLSRSVVAGSGRRRAPSDEEDEAEGTGLNA